MHRLNTETTASPRFAGIAGHAVFFALAVLAAWFWQERTLMLDAAFQSYLFIASGHPVVMVERFGAIGVQLLPLMGVKFGASLSTVLILYSVSIVLWHWILYTFCYHLLNDKRTATAILLFVILLSGDCFYWMQNELLQGISLSFVLWSLWLRWAVEKPTGSWRRVVRASISVALATTVVYFHPLIVFPLGFMWCFWWLRQERVIQRTWLIRMAILFAVLFASKYVLRTPNFYDRGMTGQYVREFHFSFHRLLHSQGLHDFWAHCSTSLLLFWPLFAFVIGFYSWQKRWWMAALVLATNLAYLLLILQRYLEDDRWYIAESYYQALAVFLIMPLVWDVFPRLKASAWLPVAVVLILFRLFSIYQGHRPYTERLQYVRTLLDASRACEGRKIILPAEMVQRKTLLMNWGLPFETLQMSALESPDSLRILTIVDEPSKAAILPRDSMVSFLMFPPRAFKDLPDRYYRLPDSLPYQLCLPALPAVR